jgi:ADP-heptose:LPS heptosyltransferase
MPSFPDSSDLSRKIPAPCLVVRLGSLGDVVLAGAVTGILAPVVFLTRRPWLDLAARLPGVVAVHDIANGIPNGPFSQIIDLQGNLRTRLLLRGPHVRRLDRADFRRRARVWWKVAPPDPVITRYAAAADVSPQLRPWLKFPPTAALPALGLVPTAAWATKRWPERHWVSLANSFDIPKILFGGPSDREHLQQLAVQIDGDPTIIAEEGFEQTITNMLGCSVIVGNDTGLLHLAAALGRPVLPLLGPTTPKDGFWTDFPQAMGIDLECRPCSRFGSSACPQHDHRCLQELFADRVSRTVAHFLREGRWPHA